MNELIEIKILKDYRIWIKFSDGEQKIVNFRSYIGKGFTAELLDYNNFKQAFIESGGGIAWPNGYDFCPNYLKELAGEEEQVPK